jgi:hypothetical protein
MEFRRRGPGFPICLKRKIIKEKRKAQVISKSQTIESFYERTNGFSR